MLKQLSDKFKRINAITLTYFSTTTTTMSVPAEFIQMIMFIRNLYKAVKFSAVGH